jgi:hypothetical protein
MKPHENKSVLSGALVKPSNNCREKAVSWAQGTYYLATGVWPLVSMRTFERVTGPKVDKWLVKTVGVLVGVIGASLMVAGSRKAVSPEARLLAVGSAAGLTAIEVTYVAKGRISPVYLLDAAGEVALLWMWRAARRRGAAGRTLSARFNRCSLHTLANLTVSYL